MAMNKAYLQSSRSAEADETYTPFYAVEPLLEYIPKGKTIWCPFDEEWSAFVQLFTEHELKVIHSHKNDGKDFFRYEPEHYDMIVSNPPYSLKDEVLKRCYTLKKPFALLMPINSIQGKTRVSLFQKNLELLVFDLRIDYHTRGNLISTTKGNHFGSAYFCNNFLPEKLVFKQLRKYDRALTSGPICKTVRYTQSFLFWN